MTPQIITVHDISAAIKDVGPGPYANKLVQEMAGDYFFVEVKGDKYNVSPVPRPLAWFVVEALRLKAQVADLGDTPGEPKRGQAVYLTPGTEIFGHKVEELTEISAELRPVCVDRL